MHVQEFADDVALSGATRLPVFARRSSQKVLLILLSGHIWVWGEDDERRDVEGPTWVVWYPGELIKYEPVGVAVHWVFAGPAGSSSVGAPRPGSLVRLQGVPEAAVLVHYMDDSPDLTKQPSLVVDVPRRGIEVHPLTDLVEVLEEADDDLHFWDFGPGLDRPRRRNRGAGGAAS